MHLLQRGQPLQHLPDVGGVALAERLLQPGEHPPLRGHRGGVGGDVLPHGAGGDLGIVDLLLRLPPAQVRHPHQLDPPLEAGEVGQLLEGGEVLLVAGGDQHLVQLEDEVLHRHLSGLTEAEEVLEGLQWSLEEVGVLHQPAVGVDQRSVRLEEHDVLERRGEVGLAPVGGDLVVGRIGAHLRLDGDRSHQIPAGKVEATDLDVTEHPQPVAVRRGQQRGVHLAALVAELAVEDPVGEDPFAVRPARLGLRRALQQLPALRPGDDEERVVAHLAPHPHLDRFGVEVGVGGELASTNGGRLLPEADAALHQLVGGEDPGHLVERALGLPGVELHPPLQPVHDGGLGRAIGPVEEDQLVHRAGPHEVAQQPVQRVLDLFLTGHPPRPLAVGEVEELEAPCGSRGVRHLRGAEMVHHLQEVLGRVPALQPGGLEEELEVLLEGKNAAVVEEVAVHHRSHLPEEVLRAHRVTPVAEMSCCSGSLPLRRPGCESAAAHSRSAAC